MTAITADVARLLAQREPQRVIPILKSISVTAQAVEKLQSGSLVFNYNGMRIRYRIIQQTRGRRDSDTLPINGSHAASG